MNQELKQRLIGAVVVTALAAIFIPMLFDDPVDDSGQAVSELSIPAVPGNSTEAVTDKLPANAEQVLTPPNAEQETPANTNPDESTEQAANNQAGSPAAPDGEEELADTSGETAPENIDQPDNEDEEGSPVALDTGVVDEAETPVQQHEDIKSKPQPHIEKPAAHEVIKKVKSPVKQTETAKPKQSVTAKTGTLPTLSKTAKTINNPPKSSPELARWYIQAGSFSKKENALSLSETLRKQGLPVRVETIQTADKGAMYRLRVGPELDKKRAMAMKATLDKQNIKTILISE